MSFVSTYNGARGEINGDPPFQITCHFDFSIYISFGMYLDINIYLDA
jgi:hypothetical protein